MLLWLLLQELHAHVEKCVGRNLQNRCSTALITAVDSAEQEMQGQCVDSVIASHRKGQSSLLV